MAAVDVRDRLQHDRGNTGQDGHDQEDVEPAPCRGLRLGDDLVQDHLPAGAGGIHSWEGSYRPARRSANGILLTAVFAKGGGGAPGSVLRIP